MNYNEVCPHCQQRVTAYTLPLNEGLVRSFVVFMETRIRLGRPVLKKELELDNVQYTHFHKLKHFRLITQPEGAATAYEATPHGWAFFHGQATVLTPIAHMGGETLDDMHHAWSTHKHARQRVTIRDVLPEEWKQRAAYAAERSGAA